MRPWTGVGRVEDRRLPIVFFDQSTVSLEDLDVLAVPSLVSHSQGISGGTSWSGEARYQHDPLRLHDGTRAEAYKDELFEIEREDLGKPFQPAIYVQ